MTVLLDDHQTRLPFKDKEMLRKEFPNVHLIEELTKGGPAGAYNAILFSLMAHASIFYSTLGGNCIISSYFGGTSVILTKEAPELVHGDFTYYHLFSNATIVVATDEASFVRYDSSNFNL